jgi:YgiT-type zinc finger domain-containing protein
MEQCPVCREGTLEDQLVETCLQSGDRWVLFKNVPAIKCDMCGETTFSQDVAERLASLLSQNSSDVPTRFVSCPEYDLARLETSNGTVGRGTAGVENTVDRITASRRPH